MSHNAKYGLMAVVLCAALLGAACGGAGVSEDDRIATAVAKTVEAQQSRPTAAPLSTPVFTPTPLQTALATLPVTPRPGSTFPPVAGDDQACMKASLVEETVPDGTILKPGEQFTKTWRIQNASTCVWNTSYKIVFWDGDLMGGGYVYSFPQQALPGDVVDVPLVLTAPSTDGSYKGSWKLQTPAGSSFGVGYDSPFWVDIVVSSDPKVDYGVTSVSYSVNRDPQSGCPANVWYTIYATITVNGPVSVTYNWKKSDGTLDDKKTIKFTQAGSKTVSMEWSLHIGSATNERWAQLFTISPIEQEYGKATFTYSCP
ncbi:MAG: NBR1-Ig-like domain-containing protein [Bacteroidota bacterium]